jgi:predicted nucleic acid-binding protein
MFWSMPSTQTLPSTRRRAPCLKRRVMRPQLFYVTSQILCEFYSIVTNARRVPKPRSPADALGAISGLLTFLHVLPVPVHTVDGWLDLLRRHPVTGGDVFDLQIVATMLANGVQRIYTFNTGDFEVFSELSVVTP